jgi:hypothetical protein
MHIEDPVELGLHRQPIQPVDFLVGEHTLELLIGLDHHGEFWRLAQPAFAVPPDPCGLRELAKPRKRLVRPGAGRTVVAAEQETVGARVLHVGEHSLQGRQVPVDVIENG